MVGDGAGHAEADCSPGSAAQIRNLGGEACKVAVDLQTFLEEQKTCWSKFKPGATALYQRLSELLLKAAQAAGHARLADQKPVGGASEASLLHDDDEGAEQVPVKAARRFFKRKGFRFIHKRAGSFRIRKR